MECSAKYSWHILLLFQRAAQERGLRALQALHAAPALPGRAAPAAAPSCGSGWARRERTPTAGGAWGLRRPRGLPGEGGRGRGRREGWPRHHPVRSAPLPPTGIAASSAVAPAVSPAPGAPPSSGIGIGVCAQDTQVGVVVLHLVPPTPTHVMSQRVCGVLSSLRVVFPRVSMSVCPPTASVGSPPSPPLPASFPGLSFHPSPLSRILAASW